MTNDCSGRAHEPATDGLTGLCLEWLQREGRIVRLGLAHRELDDALALTAMASETLANARTVKNGRHALAGLFRQSVFGRLAGYEDMNDAKRLRHDSRRPA